MLTLLRIRHYTIIDDLELELKPGFSVMTGETGAGKSILVDAVGLALGDRADSSDVLSGSERAEISAVFEGTLLWSGYPRKASKTRTRSACAERSRRKADPGRLSTVKPSP